MVLVGINTEATTQLKLLKKVKLSGINRVAFQAKLLHGYKSFAEISVKKNIFQNLIETRLRYFYHYV